MTSAAFHHPFGVAMLEQQMVLSISMATAFFALSFCQQIITERRPSLLKTTVNKRKLIRCIQISHILQ